MFAFSLKIILAIIPCEILYEREDSIRECKMFV